MTGGIDSLTVNFNTSTGVLTFKQAQDFEAPSDSNSDGVYVVRIQVTDVAGNWRYRDISITLTNANESGTISAPTISGTISKGTSYIDHSHFECFRESRILRWWKKNKYLQSS